MKKMVRSVALVLVLLCLLGCSKAGTDSVEVNGQALLQLILEKVRFDTELDDKGSRSATYFLDLPEGAEVTLYLGSAYYADCVALITVRDAADVEAARASLERYVEEMRSHFVNYQPDQVSKLDNPVYWSSGCDVLLCVAPDHKAVRSIVDNAAELTAATGGTPETAETRTTTDAPEETTLPATTAPTETVPPTTEPTATEPATEPATTAPVEETVTEPATTAPAETVPPTVAPTVSDGTATAERQPGEYYTYSDGGTYRVGDAAFENYRYVESTAVEYTQAVNYAAQMLEGQTQVYCMVIPTAIGIVLPDDVRQAMSFYEDQQAAMDRIFAKLDGNVTRVQVHEKLTDHRDEYLYFKSDFHWNGKAAYYAYEVWCEIKGITPYTLDQRRLSTFGGFRGGLYQKNCGQDPLIGVDTVEAYHPYSQNVSMVYTDRDGNQVPWKVIVDVSTWSEQSKYNTFAGGDQPLTVYKNPSVTDGSVGVIVKESFGNALIPYLVDHYSVLYEIDYRYWEGNVVEFVQSVGAQDLLFANNIGMIRTSLLTGMLSEAVYPQEAVEEDAA